MPLLQVRDVPKELYEKLSLVAAAENRSIPQETLVLLKKALDFNEGRVARRKKILDEIRNRRLPKVDLFPDPVDLIREDRDR